MKSSVIVKSGKINFKNQPAVAAEHGSVMRTAEAATGGRTPVSRPPLLVNSAVDTLVLTFQANIPKPLIERLKEDRAKVQEGNDKELFFQVGGTKIFSFNLQRMGSKLYPFILKTGDVSLCLSTRDADSSIPSMQLSVGSISCHNGLTKLLKSFRLWCSLHKIMIKEEKVSRLDLCADFVVPIGTLSLWNQAKWVTRAVNAATYTTHRKLTGVQVGTGDVVLRIYDKIQEMADKHAAHKQEFFQNIWGNVPDLTRVEFQLRRESIKTFCSGGSDFRTVAKKFANIWNYLTSEWFRQTAKSVDRLNRNQNRETVSEFWAVVQTAFDAPLYPPATRDRKQKTINIKALVEQASGIMLTVCAGLGYVHDDLFGIFATTSTMIQDRLLTLMDGSGFERDFDARAAGALVSF